MSKKIIVVTGATGAQGGGLVRAALEDGTFVVRAVTRNPASEKAQALAKLGAEVVQADLDDVDSLTRAFDGAYGAFLVTNFWEHFSADKEMVQAENMAKAAKAAGLKHVIWSTLEDTRKQIPLDDDRMPTLHGKWKVPHFDGKGASDHFFTDNNVPTTFFYVAFYWDNLLYFGMGPKRGEDGVLQLVLPTGKGKLAGVGASDIGRVAHGIFKHPELIGKKVGVAGEQLTGEEMASKLSAALGESVKFVDVTPAVYRSFGFPGADDLGNMFQHHQEFEAETLALRSPEFSRSMDARVQDFAAWLASHSAQLRSTVPPIGASA